MRMVHKTYPHRRRFCAFVDRRKGEFETDELTFFEPPKNCDTFPEGEYVQLWYLDSTKTCILPDEGYDAGRGKGKAITSASRLDNMLTFSFHADAEDSIRCYMYFYGAMMRFMPQDCIAVLPRFFHEGFGGNKKWPASYAAKALVDKMQSLLVDAKFEVFYESCM